jgi:hypothetical protein
MLKKTALLDDIRGWSDNLVSAMEMRRKKGKNPLDALWTFL